MMDKLVIYPERMIYNLNMTHGVIFSQMVLLALIEKGHNHGKMPMPLFRIMR